MSFEGPVIIYFPSQSLDEEMMVSGKKKMDDLCLGDKDFPWPFPHWFLCLLAFLSDTQIYTNIYMNIIVLIFIISF